MTIDEVDGFKESKRRRLGAEKCITVYWILRFRNAYYFDCE